MLGRLSTGVATAALITACFSSSANAQYGGFVGGLAGGIIGGAIAGSAAAAAQQRPVVVVQPRPVYVIQRSAPRRVAKAKAPNGGQGPSKAVINTAADPFANPKSSSSSNEPIPVSSKQ